MKWPNGEVATEEEVKSAYEDGLIDDDEFAIMMSILNDERRTK